MAFVELPDMDSSPLVVNVGCFDAEQAVSDVATVSRLTPYTAYSDTIPTADFLVPSDTASMILRASNNIVGGLTSNPVPLNLIYLPMLLACCVQFLLNPDRARLRGLLGGFIAKSFDAVLIVDELLPVLPDDIKVLVEAQCNEVMHAEEVQSDDVYYRQTAHVRYFVGMHFFHLRNVYNGFIVGWDIACKADEQWVTRMGVDLLHKGRNQPFYKVYVEDGSERYVAEENIEPCSFSREQVEVVFEKFPDIPYFFEDAQLPDDPTADTSEAIGRGRLLLSPQMKADYPQDDGKGMRWVQDGIFTTMS